MTHINITGNENIIEINNGKLEVPNNPTVCYIEGDGIGSDITPVCLDVINAAVEKAYNGEKKINFLEVYAGEKATKLYGEHNYLPTESMEAIKKFKISLKGPLATPTGGGIRSLNVALRQQLDLFACVRPVKHFSGVPAPVKRPDLTDMIIFRENTEDIYAGIEFQNGTAEQEKLLNFLQDELGVTTIRFPQTSSLGIKPTSSEGSKRLMRSAVEYAIANNRKSVTVVHKGNIMKFTEGSFKNWCFELAAEEFGDKVVLEDNYNPETDKDKIVIQSCIADAFLQELLLRPTEHDVVVAMNLNGDYISDALAACVGGIGIAPGANINYSTGVAIFEATHGTAPKYAGLNKVNPSSIILSAEMMLRYFGWNEAADLVVNALEKTIESKTVTYDFARLMDDAIEVSCSDFGKNIIKNM